MNGLWIPGLPADAARITSLGVYLGSFDPLHRGHEWLAGQLLERCARVLLLVPSVHFHKRIRTTANATLAQRLAMIHCFSKRERGLILGGVAEEVLFVRLALCLRAVFPAASLTFGMGDDTFDRLLRSRHYFTRQGLAWTPEAAAGLEWVRVRTMVFGRSGNGPGRITVPEPPRGISSTAVRAAVAAGDWAALEAMVAPDIAWFIRREGLYAGPAGR